MASTQLQGLLENFRAAGSFRGDVAAMRKMISRAPAYPKPDDVTWEAVDVAGVPGEWTTPEGCEPGRTVVYLHGGGYATGSVEAFRSVTTHLARAARSRVLAVDYRLAPEHPFPSALDDAIAAYRFVLAAGTDPGRVALAGDSSGGGLALAALVALRDLGEPLPATAVLLCPWTDMALTGGSIEANAGTDPMVSAATLAMMADAYLGDLDRRTPAASPLYADLAGLPPLLVQVATGELLADDSKRLAERATAAGVEVTLELWDDAFHVWHSFADLVPEAREAITRIGAHLDRHLGAAG